MPTTRGRKKTGGGKRKATKSNRDPRHHETFLNMELLDDKKRSNNRECLEKFQGGNKDTFLGPDQTKTYPCLGVPAEKVDGFVNLIDPNTAYGRLSRPARIPGKCPTIPDGTDEEQGILQKFWDGEFKVSEEEVAELGLQFTATRDNVSLEISFSCNELGKSQHGRYQMRVVGGMDPSAQRWWGCQNGKILRRLNGRILHHYLRQRGWLLCSDMLQLVCVGLKKTFESKRHKSTRLDICILEGDILRNMHVPGGISRVDHLVCVGKALAAIGNQDDEALEHYIAALSDIGKANGGKWVFNDERTLGIIRDLLALHHDAAYHSGQADKGGLVAAKKDIKLAVGLHFLVNSGGNKLETVDEKTEKLNDWYFNRGTDYIRLIQRKLRSKKGETIATSTHNNLLCQALFCGSVSKYKKTILSIFLEQMNVSHNLLPKDMLFPTENSMILATISICDYCDKKSEPNDYFLECSTCKQVCYCSKDCQLRDWWKYHKRSLWHEENGEYYLRSKSCCWLLCSSV